MKVTAGEKGRKMGRDENRGERERREEERARRLELGEGEGERVLRTYWLQVTGGAAREVAGRPPYYHYQWQRLGHNQ
jgi:hypothetical protein